MSLTSQPVNGMTYPRELKQAAPEPARRLQEQATSSTAPPYQMEAPARKGHKRVREAARMIDITEFSLRPEEVHFFDHGEQDSNAHEDSHHSVRISGLSDSHSVEYLTPPCVCGPKCQCKPACKYQVHGCPCASYLPQQSAGDHENAPAPRRFEVARPELQHIPTDHTRKIDSYDIDLDNAQVERSLNDGAMPKQNSQAARVPHRKDVNVGTPSAETLYLRRQRTATINNNLAYVPPAATKTPSRKQKDTVPLGFYGTHGSHSGQRYPNFSVGPSLSKTGIPTRPVFAAAPGTSDQAQSLEPIAQTLLQFSGSSPECRTVEPKMRSNLRSNSTVTMSDRNEDGSDMRTPSPLSAPRQRRYQCNKTHAAITGEDIKGYSNFDEYQQGTPSDLNEFAEPSSDTVTYPEIPRSTSAGLFIPGVFAPAVTQSFPLVQSGHPRDPESSPDQTEVPREDWYGHENNLFYIGNESTPARHSSPASSVGRRVPPSLPVALPLPNFIAPRPATKQRYVSAGGTAKLGDRPEITDFALPPSVTPGISMQRDLLLQRLEAVPVFATPTRSITIGSPMPIRSSEEALRDSSARTSYDGIQDLGVPKRDRKESGSSQRIARLIRVFSFGKDG